MDLVGTYAVKLACLRVLVGELSMVVTLRLGLGAPFPEVLRYPDSNCKLSCSGMFARRHGDRGAWLKKRPRGWLAARG